MAEIPQDARIFKGVTRERARRAMLAALQQETRNKKVITGPKVRQFQPGDNNCATTCLRLWNEGRLDLGDSWDDAPAPAAAPATSSPRPAATPGADESWLVALIRGAQSHDDLLEAGKELAARALGGLAPDVVARLTQLLTEMRQSVKGRAQEPRESVESILPVTDEARPLVEAFEGIADDEARARVLAHVLAAAEEDRRRRPGVDTGGAQA